MRTVPEGIFSGKANDRVVSFGFFYARHDYWKRLIPRARFRFRRGRFDDDEVGLLHGLKFGACGISTCCPPAVISSTPSSCISFWSFSSTTVSVYYVGGQFLLVFESLLGGLSGERHRSPEQDLEG